MENFLKYVISQLVDYPDDIVVSRVDHGKRVLFRVRLKQTDIGKVIGKNGHTIAAIRSLLAAGGARTGVHAVVDIVDDQPRSC